MTHSRWTKKTLLELVAELIRQLKGIDTDIDEQTLCGAELGMVSIDAVVLAEQLESAVGARLPFHEFLAELRERAEIDPSRDDIRVGEIVDLVFLNLPPEKRSN